MDMNGSADLHGYPRGAGAVAPLTSRGCVQGRFPGVGIALGSDCAERISRWTLQKSRPGNGERDI